MTAHDKPLCAERIDRKIKDGEKVEEDGLRQEVLMSLGEAPRGAHASRRLPPSEVETLRFNTKMKTVWA